MEDNLVDGQYLHSVLRKLFPICRSIMGNGVRESLSILGQYFIGARIYEVPSDTKCFDWVIPEEWTIRDAYLIGPSGNKVVDFANCNLHVLSYSIPIDKTMTLDELQPYLHSIESQPDAVPYVTSYYKRTWGFCLAHNLRKGLPEGNYRAVIDSALAPGALTYGEILLPGESDKEILISSYICHPSMANNELSGPIVAFALAKWLSQKNNYYTYRIAVFPETIGAIAYISQNLEALKKNVVAGFQLSCIGDDRSYSFVSSPNADTLADRAARHVYYHTDNEFKEYDFLQRGSDERQFCSPKVGIPLVTLMRTKFGMYPEYHTSLDDLTVVTAKGLENGFKVAMRCVEAVEENRVYEAVHHCEPHLGKYGLRDSTSHINLADNLKVISDILAFADGKRDLIALSERINRPVWEVLPALKLLEEHGLVQVVSDFGE
ncbi:MAG: DUF4910 domain-containing protein [Thalassospira sp.]|uniref:DUF4910 domain-containing protein n=1 Tax=Thalassospira sp. TaxID=1912094 RepID=UPI0032EFCAB6